MNPLEESTFIISKLDQTNCVGQVLNNKANEACLSRDWEIAFEFARRSLELCRQKPTMRYVRSAGIAEIHLAAIHHAMGNDQHLKEAARHYESSIGYFANDRRNRAVALLAKALVRRRLKEWGVAVEALQFCLDILEGPTPDHLKGLDSDLCATVREEIDTTIRLWDEERTTGAPKDQPVSEPPTTEAPRKMNTPRPDPGFETEGATQATKTKERTDTRSRTKRRLAFIALYLILFTLLSLILVLIGLLTGDKAYLVAATVIILVVIILPPLGLWLVLPGLSGLGLLYNIREGEVAVIEAAGRLEVRQSPGICLCLPVLYRLRAIVPTWEQSTRRIIQVADKDRTQIKSTLDIRYQINAPSRIAYFALQQEVHPRKSPLQSTEIQEACEDQVSLNLSTAVADVFAKEKAESAWENREDVQESIRERMNRENRESGILTTNICLLQIEES